MKCLYCNLEEFNPGEGSEEHVIISALGGRKSSKNICCEACNNKYGREIDTVLASQFHFFCTMIGIKTGRGKSAPTHAKMLAAEEEDYDLLPGGTNRLSANKMEFQESDKDYTISIMARDEEAALNLMRSAAKKYGKELKDFPSLLGSSITAYPDLMHVNLSITQECYRSLAKMALTYAATLISPERLRGKDFSAIKNYITGETLANDFVRIESSLLFHTRPKTDDLNHRIFFYSNDEKACAVALIELFGHFRFSVLLTNSWSGGLLAKAHVINPVTHERFDSDIPISDNVFDQIHRLSDAQQIRTVQEAIASVGAIISERQTNIFISQTVAKAFNYREGEPDRLISQDDFEKALKQISLDMARFIARAPVEEAVDLSEFLSDQDNEENLG